MVHFSCLVLKKIGARVSDLRKTKKASDSERFSEKLKKNQVRGSFLKKKNGKANTEDRESNY